MKDPTESQGGFARMGNRRAATRRSGPGWPHLQVLLCAIALVLLPRLAMAQYVYDDTWAGPNPFEQDDEITIGVEGSWDSYTSDWPCEEDPEDGYCTVQEHDVYVWGSDEYYDSDGTMDWGDSTGEDSWEFYDVDGPAYMQPIGYSTEIDVEYCDEWYYSCWWVSDDAEADVEPDGPTISSNNGDTVWWFNGESPSGYVMSIDLTSSAGSSTTWAITAGSGKVSLSASSGATVTVTPSGSSFSTAPGDVSITATAGGSDSTPFTVTVRRPGALAPGTISTDPDATWAYLSYVNYTMEDQLSDTLPSPAPVNEAWTTGVADDWFPVYGVHMNWTRASPGGFTPPSGASFADEIGGETSSGTPSPTCCTDSTAVTHWGQDWYIGSVTSGNGVGVQHDTLQKYLGHALHTGISGW